MNLKLVREPSAGNSTLGTLYVNNTHQCYTCEDIEREGPKVYGKTAIPPGTYEVIISMSNRFKRLLPEVLKVPGFEGIRIHAGNTSADTEGCILVGTKLDRLKGVIVGGTSRPAFDALFAKLKSAFDSKEKITITIESSKPST